MLTFYTTGNCYFNRNLHSSTAVDSALQVLVAVFKPRCLVRINRNKNKIGIKAELGSSSQCLLG